MKKLILFFCLFAGIVSGQISVTPLNNWQQSGNSVGTNTAFIGTNDNRSLFLKTNGIDRVKIDSVGRLSTLGSTTLNVGAGSYTYNPGAILSVINATGAAISSVYTRTNNSYSQFALGANTSTSATGFYHTSSDFIPNGLYLDNSMFIQTYSKSMLFDNATSYGNIVLSTNSTNRFNISKEGRIGINNATPSASLHLIGTSLLTNTSTGVNTTTYGIVRICQNTATLDIGEGSYEGSGYVSFWATGNNNTVNNPFITTNGAITDINGTSRINLTVNAGNRLAVASNSIYLNNPTFIGGNTFPTAKAHIAANTVTSANSAPIKLTVSGSSLMATPEAGAMETDANGLLQWTETSGLRKAFCGALYTQTAAVTVSNTTVSTNVLTNTINLPANAFTIGKSIEIELYGFHSGALTPTISYSITLDGNSVLTTGSVNSGNSTNELVNIKAVLTCYSTGTVGTIQAQGQVREFGGGVNNFSMVNTSPVTVNTTISHYLGVMVKWGTASIDDILTITNGKVIIVR